MVATDSDGVQPILTAPVPLTLPNLGETNVPGRPVIGVPASLMEIEQRRFPAHLTGARNINAVVDHADCLPLIIPALGDQLDAGDLVERLDGLLLTGGRANVEPHHYGGPEFPEDEPIDKGRDAVVLPLVRACIEHKVPIFGVCRGIQEMNVAMGGSLHYRIHLLEGKEDHRMPRHDNVTMEEIFKLRHAVALRHNGLFASLIGADTAMVNSLHGQGIQDLADAFCVEATSPDEVIEGIRLVDDETFTVGVQWHAEHQPETHELSRKLFESFGEAARDRQRARGRVTTSA